MKYVILTQRLSEVTEYPETREGLDIRWAGFLDACGLVPVVLPSTVDPEYYFGLTEIVGIVLTGGNDPARINDTRLNRRRDAVDERAVKFASHKQLPVLGVCRGMQFLTAHFGGSLAPVGNHVAVRHSLFPGPGPAPLPEFASRESVNSFHQFGVTEAPVGFNACAVTEDGSIEAMADPKRSLYGIMWHPEREENYDESDIRLFQAIFLEQS